MNKPDTRFIVKAGMIAAIYAVLTMVFSSLSYGPVQYRLSEAMTILPMFIPEAIPGLAIGCFIANIIGGYGLADVVFGSLVTLAAAYLTSKITNKYFAILPPIIMNAVFVSIWVSKSADIPYWMSVGSIGFGEFVTAGILGVLLASYFEKRYHKNTVNFH
jgi:uncharacterized membrane protein